jgi:hypothetical protein
MMTMAFPVTAFGIWVELAYEPPLWVHFVTTLPMLLLACIPILRPIKGILVASQYINKAEEGRFERPKEQSRGNEPSDAGRRWKITPTNEWATSVLMIAQEVIPVLPPNGAAWITTGLRLSEDDVASAS